MRLLQRKRFGAIYAILSIAEIELPEFPVECVCTSPSSDFSRFIANRLRPWGPESWRVLSPVPRLGKHFRQSNLEKQHEESFRWKYELSNHGERSASSLCAVRANHARAHGRGPGNRPSSRFCVCGNAQWKRGPRAKPEHREDPRRSARAAVTTRAARAAATAFQTRTTAKRRASHANPAGSPADHEETL